MSRFLFTPVFMVGVITVLAGCENQKKPPNTWPDGLLAPDGQLVLDSAAADLGLPPDLNNDVGGPEIVVLKPKDQEIVIGDVLIVQAEIKDKDGIDDQSVTVTLQGGEPVKMTITATPNVYEAILEVTAISDKGRLWVTAADLTGKNSSKVVEFQRDAGPKILFLSPEEGSRHRGSVSVQVLVADTRTITPLEVKIGSYPLVLTQSSSDPHRQIWVGTVKFDDKQYEPPLSGKQVLTATASNENKALSTVQRFFFVDDQGPSLDITSQKPGELIGGIIHLEVNVKDLAGVLPSTVRCVIGNNLESRTVVLKNTIGTPDVYDGQFDTRTLSQYDLWPVMSFRAADKLGNESHKDIQVGLDNGQPIVEIDPPREFYMGRIKDHILECSHPFDPVGVDAVNDLQSVPQVIKIRVRIEDQGNHVPSAPWIPIALVNPATTWIYVLDDTTKALAVDTDGDGVCDSINPEIIPLGSTPKPEDAVAVNISPVIPSGSADFTLPPDGTVMHPACDDWGSDAEPPDALCLTTPATLAIFYTVDNEPAIYGIPPIEGGSKSLKCFGLPFDFKANSFQEGWACAAAVADDNLGNRGVSPPVRLYVNYKLEQQNPPQPPPVGAGTPPHCTGTLDKNTGKVDSSKPCKYRNPRATINCDTSMEFPQQFCRMELRVQ